MNVGVDYRMTSQFLTGIGSYTRSLVASLTDVESEFKYFLYTDVRSRKNGKALERVVPFRRRNIWNQVMPFFLRKDKIDIYHATSNFDVPLYKNTKLVCTVCDMAPLSFPGLYPKKHRFLFRALIGRALAMSDTVVTISEASKDEIISFFPKWGKKIVPIHLGCDPRFVPMGGNVVKKMREKFTSGHPFCLYLGTHEPKKNLSLLLRAFKIVFEKTGASFRLVIAGKEDMYTDKLKKLVRSLSIDSRVVFPGYIPDDELPALYNGADLFIFPSFHEGFGIPVLEAMSCGIPVLCSSIPALRELAGDAGSFFESNNIADLAQSMEKILSDPSQREIMKKNGLTRSRCFSWKKTACETVQVYEKLYTK